MMIPQCKGKDLIQVPKSKLAKEYYVSIKYDGNYVQIHKNGNVVRFYTSGGKEFYLVDLAEELISRNESADFIIECEYIADTGGKLGSRGKCTTTTFRTEFKKGIKSYLGKNRFRMFNVIAYRSYYENDGKLIHMQNFNHSVNMFRFINTAHTNIDKVTFKGPMPLEECKVIAKNVIELGYEGVMLSDPKAEYIPGKHKYNSWIKLKDKPTADLKCFGVLPGEGKYEDMIGSLQLVDDKGVTVCVGSGLSDMDRNRPIDYFMGKIIEVQYESFKDTYIQPVYKGVRNDKA